MLVSSVSNFCPDTRGQGGHFFRLPCSVVLWGGRNTANITGMCGSARSVSATLGLPPLKACCFPSLHRSGSRLLCWELSEAGPGLCAPPRSKLLRFRFSGTPQRRRLAWTCVLCPSQVRAAQVTRCLVSTLSPRAVCLITSPIPAAGFPGVQREHLLGCAVCLLRGTDLWLQPSWRMSTVQDPRKTWLATGNLLAVW